MYSNVIYLRPDAGQRDPGHYIQERPGYRVFIQYKGNQGDRDQKANASSKADIRRLVHFRAIDEAA